MKKALYVGILETHGGLQFLSWSDFDVAIRVFGPLHNDVGEVDCEDESGGEVSPEPFSRVLKALLAGHSATEVNFSCILNVRDILIHLRKIFWSAVVLFNLTCHDQVCVVAIVEDKGTGQKDKEEHIFGRFGWADPSHDPNKAKDGWTHEVWKEQFPETFGDVGLVAETNGAEDCDDTEEFYSTVEWEAEAALFSHKDNFVRI